MSVRALIALALVLAGLLQLIVAAVWLFGAYGLAVCGAVLLAVGLFAIDTDRPS